MKRHQADTIKNQINENETKNRVKKQIKYEIFEINYSVGKMS